MRTLILILAVTHLSCRSKEVPFDTSTNIDSDSATEETATPVDADGDGFSAAEDCDDADASIHPTAIDDDCDGIDENCDGQADEGAVWETYYLDADGDGYGNEQETQESCDGTPSGHVAAQASGFDCNDSSDRFHPGAQEWDCLDPNDYNCDGSISFADVDGDHYPACQDCNDADASANPGQAEVCDEIDNNCDGLIDEGVTTTFYADTDADGFGDETSTVEACATPSGYVAEQTDGFDCNDGSGDFFPGAPETDCADPNDYNCDGTVVFEDLDSDGFGACVDCDDTNAAVNTNATEVCNGIDDDCNGATDDADAGLDTTTRQTFYADSDADGAGTSQFPLDACSQPSGYVSDNTDCDDTNPARSPFLPEVCDSADLDEDCDGLADDNDLEGATGTTTWYPDLDIDGYGDSSHGGTELCEPGLDMVTDNTDCDDSNAGRNPGLTEACDSADLDEDCDGLADNDDPDGATGTATWYPDTDSDNYGDSSNAGSELCDPVSGFVTDNTDCDDSLQGMNPAEAEVCDSANLDEDCDGFADDDDPEGASGTQTFYVDSDGDGYGSTTTISSCDAHPGLSTTSDDCDDATTSINPGQTEACDGLDNDCDGTADSTSACGCNVEYYGSTTDPYLFCTSGQSWNDASAACQSLGYHLVSIADDAENTWVDNTADTYSTSKWHIGFTDQWSEGTWVWSDGSPVTYTNWQSGEPNGGTNESCAQVNRFHPSTTWNDEPCGQGLPFVCEYQ